MAATSRSKWPRSRCRGSDGAASVFEGGGTAVEGTASEVQVDLLYRQIGQLKVENDFLARSPAPRKRQWRRSRT